MDARRVSAGQEARQAGGAILLAGLHTPARLTAAKALGPHTSLHFLGLILALVLLIWKPLEERDHHIGRPMLAGGLDQAVLLPGNSRRSGSP